MTLMSHHLHSTFNQCEHVQGARAQYGGTDPVQRAERLGEGMAKAMHTGDQGPAQGSPVNRQTDRHD